MATLQELVAQYIGKGDPHGVRYEATLKMLQSWIPSPCIILDIGGSSCDNLAYVPLQRMMEALDYIVMPLNGPDLREPFPVADNAFKFAICTEVLEHIKDQECDPKDRFLGRCRQNLLKEIKRVIQPGGRILLSTPNSCALSNAHRLALGYTPLMYCLHQQEISPGHLRELVRVAGLEVVHFTTQDVWGRFNMSDAKAEAWIRFFIEQGYSLHERGDCTMVILGVPQCD